MSTKTTIRRYNLIKKRALQRRRGKSKLDKHSYEIIALRHAGASLAAIQFALKELKIKAERSTIKRWIDKHGNF